VRELLEILIAFAAIVVAAKLVANRIAAAPERRWRKATALELAEIRRLEREILERETAPARLTP
jgi:hypothetical protein